MVKHFNLFFVNGYSSHSDWIDSHHSVPIGRPDSVLIRIGDFNVQFNRIAEKDVSFFVVADGKSWWEMSRFAYGAKKVASGWWLMRPGDGLAVQWPWKEARERGPEWMQCTGNSNTSTNDAEGVFPQRMFRSAGVAAPRSWWCTSGRGNARSWAQVVLNGRRRRQNGRPAILAWPLN